MGLSKHLLIIIVLAVFVGAVAAQTSPNLISGSSQIKDFSKYYGFVKIDYWSMKANAQVSHIVALRRSDYYSSYSLWIAQDQSFPLDPSFTDTVHNKVTLSYLDSQGNPTTKFNFEFVKGGNGALGVKITDPNGNSCYSAKSGADQLGYIYNLQAEPSVRQTIYFLPPPIQS
ncbi:MAG: hypothetical protein Q7R47_04230, partial [Candidatus Diapherotrites archaeon]|nr:hypothetical protein [Candidatus Diapherotrites archaeon]